MKTEEEYYANCEQQEQAEDRAIDEDCCQYHREKDEELIASKMKELKYSGRCLGKSISHLASFISKIKEGKRTLLIGCEYVCMSIEMYKILIAKVGLKIKEGEEQK